MKRITLITRGAMGAEPFTCPVEFETDTHIEVKPKWAMKPMLLTKQADGSFKNEHHVVYDRVKPDVRRKPFSVQYVSGIGEGSVTKKFATLAEVQEYVKGRWQGVDYIDGPGAFHGDFGHFYLKGCTLADLGKREGPDGFDWSWLTL
jgi:hypothetical protein